MRDKARVTAGAAVTVVAVVGAVLSFSHLSGLAARSGEAAPWLVPVSVEGLIVCSSMVLLVRSRTGQRAPLAWSGLLLGVAATLVGNVVAAEPNTVARVIAAWPAVAFIVAFELLLSLVRASEEQPQAVSDSHRPVAGSQTPEEEPVKAAVDQGDSGTESPVCPDRAETTAEPLEPVSVLDNARTVAEPVSVRTTAEEKPVRWTDEEILAELRAADPVPGRNATMNRYRIGTGRATRLLDQVKAEKRAAEPVLV